MMSHLEVVPGREVPGNVRRGLVRLGLETTRSRQVRGCHVVPVVQPVHGPARLGPETTRSRQVRGCHAAPVVQPVHGPALPAVVPHGQVAEGLTPA